MHFTSNGPLFHRHSRNICRIANLNVGGQRTCKTAQYAHLSCHDKIRTDILHCSQSCGNRKVGTNIQFKLGWKCTVLYLVQVPTRHLSPGPVAWWFLTWTGVSVPVPIQTEARSPGTTANTIHHTGQRLHNAKDQIVALDEITHSTASRIVMAAKATMAGMAGMAAFLSSMCIQDYGKHMTPQ